MSGNYWEREINNWNAFEKWGWWRKENNNPIREEKAEIKSYKRIGIDREKKECNKRSQKNKTRSRKRGREWREKTTNKVGKKETESTGFREKKRDSFRDKENERKREN